MSRRLDMFKKEQKDYTKSNYYQLITRSMNKKAIWWVMGAVVVIGALILFSGTSDAPTGDTTTDGAGDTAGSSMVASAFTGSGSVKCDYSQDGGLVGTAYVKGGKVRIEGTVEGGTANVIYGNGKVYTWGTSDGQEYGFVIDTPTSDASVAAGTQSLPSRTDLENQFTGGSARCENYNAPDSFFTPPPSVKFQSMTELLNMMPAGAGPGGY